MTSDIGLILKSYLTPLPFADRIAGIVKPITKSDEKGIKKTFPVDCGVTEPDCLRGRYTDLVPNTKYNSIMYFEDQGINILNRTSTDFNFSARLKLVGWLNLKKLGKEGCSLSSLAITNILKAFPTNYFNSGIYNRIQISVSGQDPKDARIFSKYSYSEEQTQYLMYPFDYFALNITVNFSIREACIPDWTISTPTICIDPETDVECGVVTIKDNLGNIIAIVQCGQDYIVAPSGDATVRNSDSTFLESVACAGELILEDIIYNVNVNGVFNQTATLPSEVDNTINIT